MKSFLEILLKEIEILEIEKNINAKVRKQIDKMQKEYYLREQMKAIQSELGDKEGITGEVEEFKEKLKMLIFLKKLKKRSEGTGPSIKDAFRFSRRFSDKDIF